MATSITGTGDMWRLPNYDGQLFTADAVPGQAGNTGTPFLSMIGGLNGGYDYGNLEFPLSAEYDFPAAAQPAITETASVAGVTAREYVLDQTRNTCQIFQEAITLSYMKESMQNRMTAVEVSTSGLGYLASGVVNEKGNEMAWQTTQALRKIARDLNYSMLNGSYQQATSAAVAAKMRGVISAVSSNTVAAGGATLTKAMVQELLRECADNSSGQTFGNMPVFFVNSFNKQKLSDIYGYAPEDRNIGGVNIKVIETDFGNVGVMYEPMVPAATILLAAVRACRPVFNPVPGKGRLFDEPLAKDGASSKRQLYGQIGIDYGPEWLHGTITNTATS